MQTFSRSLALFYRRNSDVKETVGLRGGEGVTYKATSLAHLLVRLEERLLTILELLRVGQETLVCEKALVGFHLQDLRVCVLVGDSLEVASVVVYRI